MTFSIMLQTSYDIPFYWATIGLVLGLSIGSFINAASYRIPLNKSLLTPSSCPTCHHSISFYDNIPLLSFLILKGQCRHCQTKISWRYFYIEALGGLIGLIDLYGAPNLYDFVIFLFDMFVIYFVSVKITSKTV